MDIHIGAGYDVVVECFWMKKLKNDRISPDSLDFDSFFSWKVVDKIVETVE